MGSVLPRILSRSCELVRSVGARSVRLWADNVRPYIRACLKNVSMPKRGVLYPPKAAL